jgi:ParB/RepB/Spo0J family partition protein
MAQEEFNLLKENIKSHGILQPIVVIGQASGRFKVLAGKRRLQVAQELHLSDVPCNVIVSALENDGQENLITVCENIQRKASTPYEQGRLFRMIIDKTDLPQDEVAKLYGVAKSLVTDYLKLLTPEIEQKLGRDKYEKLMRGEYSAKAALRQVPSPAAKENRGLLKEFIDADSGIAFRVRGLDAALSRGLTREILIAALERYKAALKSTGSK